VERRNVARHCGKSEYDADAADKTSNGGRWSTPPVIMPVSRNYGEAAKKRHPLPHV
jgi:hypothetical protein